MNNNKDVIIITGCSGRIGTHAMKRFNDPRFQVIGFDVIPPQCTESNFEYMNVDLTSDESVNNAMNAVRQKYGSRIASVIHLAAYYNFAGGYWEKYETLTIHGTKRLLEAVKTFDTEQFIFSSTMLVHAPSRPGEKINENSPLIMNWEYPKSKVLTEELLKENHDKIPLVILQIAGCYDDVCHSIPIAQQIQRIYEHSFESRLFPGDLTHGASFLHLVDMADVLYRCYERREGLPHELTLLIGEEETLSYDQLQRQIARLIDGKEFKTYRIPKWFAKLGAWVENHLPLKKETFIKPWMIDIADDDYELDISNAKKYIGWQPKRSLRQTLPIMIQALKANPKRWYQENELS
jgi:nucleoside-diphosphate-sugar epimerase